MLSRIYPRPVASILLIALVTLFCATASAQRGASKYNKGDQVEVKDGFDWVPGTVVSVDPDTGWVEVQAKGRTNARPFPARNVRASQTAPAAAPAAADTPLRKWSDRTGKFNVQARYLGKNADRVTLLKEDGKRLEVPIAKLSDEDASYLKELDEAGESPFEEVGGESIPAAEPAASPAGAPAAAGRIKKGNWNGAKLVQPQNFKKWSFKPPAPKRATQPSSSTTDLNVALTDIPFSKKFFEDIEGVYAAADGSRVVVCRNKGEVSNDKEMYLEMVDVEKQRAGGLAPLPDTTLVLDIEPSANLVMYRPAVFGSGDNNVLTVAQIEGKKLTPVQQWEPYSHETFPPSRDIEKGWFLDENRVMTINGHGKTLTIWDVAACKALINIPVGVSFSLQAALSPDRQLLAIVMKDGIALIDVVQGKHVATVPGGGRRFQKVAIRNDNTRLAGLSDEGVTVWNLADGKMMSEFYSTSVGWNSGLEWAGDFVLADSRYLFDVERRIMLWEYQDPPGTGVTARLQNGQLYAVTKPHGDNGAVTLVSASIPNGAALEMAKSLPPAEELLVVRPGDSVMIEVDIDPSVSIADAVQKFVSAGEAAGGEAENKDVVFLNPNGAQNDVLRQVLTKSLEAAGLNVVEKSDLVVKAICKPQPPQTIRVRIDNRFPPRPDDYEERTITPHASYLEMTLKGETLWKRGFVAQPHMMIWMQAGETLDQALERMTKPNVTLFTNAKFCPYVARPGKATPNGAYGMSQFTARGLVDGRAGAGTNGASFE